MAKSNSDFIDIPALIRQYISKWYLFVISVVICGGIAVAYALLRQQDYAVKANILITPEKDSPLSGGLMDGLGSLFGSQGYVEDEIFIISSHSLYASVAKELGLNVSQNVKKNIFVRELAYPEKPLEVTPQAGMLDTLRTAITFTVKVAKDGCVSIKGKMKRATVVDEKNLQLPFTVDTPLGQFSFAKTQYFPADDDLNVRVSVKGYGNAAEDLAKEVTTEIAAKHSNVLAVGMATPNPEYGTAVLNEIFKEYNERGIEESRQRNELTASFIEGRLNLLAVELSDVEASMQKYKQSNGIVDVVSEAKYQTEKRGKVEAELLAAETQAEIIKLTLQFLRDPRNAYALIPTALDNEGLQKAITVYNELVLERMSLASSARSENIALKELSERIDASRENIIMSISRAYDTSMVAVNDLRREMRAAES